MKRERRHELHTNLLAEWLTSAITKVKPHLNIVLAVALLVLLVFTVATLWARYSSGGKEQAWDAFNHALQEGYPNPASFDKLAEDHPGTDVAHWSLVTAADVYLQQGCEQILRDKGAANQQLQKALEHYLTVLKESRVDALQERATFGLARTYESLSGTRRAENELQKAIESYESVVKKWPKGAYAEMASRRLDELRLPDTKRFYDKLAQYDPKPAFADTPGGPGKDLDLGAVPPEPEKKAVAPKTDGSTSKPPATKTDSPPTKASTDSPPARTK